MERPPCCLLSWPTLWPQRKQNALGWTTWPEWQQQAVERTPLWLNTSSHSTAPSRCCTAASSSSWSTSRPLRQARSPLTMRSCGRPTLCVTASRYSAQTSSRQTSTINAMMWGSWPTLALSPRRATPWTSSWTSSTSSMTDKASAGGCGGSFSDERVLEGLTYRGQTAVKGRGATLPWEKPVTNKRGAAPSTQKQPCWCGGRCVIYSDNLEDSIEYQWVSRKPPPLLSGSFSFEMECVINQTLYTLKHQLDNLKFSLIFIKYSCFKRQSECKNVNVIKHHWPGYFLLQLFTLLWMNWW